MKYLMGDGHLGLLDTARLGDGWVNLARPGATAEDIVRQLLDLPLMTQDDLIVFSMGTNDAGPTTGVLMRTFLAQVEQVMRGAFPAHVACLLPPGVDESRLTPGWGHTNVVVLQWADAAARLAAEDGAMVLDLRASLAPLGNAAFADDGLHLSEAGNEVLLDLLRLCAEQAACESTARTAPQTAQA